MGAHRSLGTAPNIGTLLQGTEPALPAAARGVCAGAGLLLIKAPVPWWPGGAAPPCPTAFPSAHSRACQRSAGGEEGEPGTPALATQEEEGCGGHLGAWVLLWPSWLQAGHVGPAPLQLLPPGPLLEGL